MYEQEWGYRCIRMRFALCVVLIVHSEGHAVIYVILFAPTRPVRAPRQSFAFRAPIVAFSALGEETSLFPLPRD